MDFKTVKKPAGARGTAYTVQPVGLVVPATPARGGWTVDREVLTAVLSEMPIDLPVTVKYVGARYTFGTHYARGSESRGYWHAITLNQDLNRDNANETLWHELRHAFQAERYALRYNRPITKFHEDLYLDGISYKDKPLETDAREYAAKVKGIYLLKGM